MLLLRKVAQLIHKRKIILDRLDYRTSLFGISFGLMFSSKAKARRGVCLVMPSSKDVQFGSSVTMLFVFYSLEILFVNLEGVVVDKVLLRPWISSYTPQAPAKYIIESTKGTFDMISIGDKVSIKH